MNQNKQWPKKGFRYKVKDSPVQQKTSESTQSPKKFRFLACYHINNLAKKLIIKFINKVF